MTSLQIVAKVQSLVSEMVRKPPAQRLSLAEVKTRL
jgi:hypothetical protein